MRSCCIHRRRSSLGSPGTSAEQRLRAEKKDNFIKWLFSTC